MKHPEPWVIFLGAGASVDAPTLLPDFQALAKQVLESIGWSVDRAPTQGQPAVWSRPGFPPFRDPGRAISPEVLFGTLRAFDVPFVAPLANALDVSAPNAVHRIAAQVLAAGGMVWTTNVDRAVEAACRNLAPRFGRRTNSLSSASHELGPLREACLGGLVKFHGTAELPESLAFTDRELLTPLPEPTVNHLAELVRGHTLVFYGYAGADADLADLVEASLKAAKRVVWFEPSRTARADISLFFPNDIEEFLPNLNRGDDPIDATRSAFAQLATRAGYSYPPPVAADHEHDPERTLSAKEATQTISLGRLAVPAITHARLVARFGSSRDEAEAFRSAWSADKGGRRRVLKQYARWELSRRIYGRGLIPRLLLLAIPLRRILAAPGVRRIGNAIMLRQFALLLTRGKWRRLRRFCDWSIDHRTRSDGSSHPEDHYYRAYSRRYALEPGGAAEDSLIAVRGLANALDAERLAGALLEAGAAAIYQGRFDDALRRSFELQYRRGRYAIPRWQAWGAWLEGVTHAFMGNPQEAYEPLDRADLRFEDEGYAAARFDVQSARVLADRVAVASGEKSISALRKALALKPTNHRQRNDKELLQGELALAEDCLIPAFKHFQSVLRNPSCDVAASWAEVGQAEVARRQGRLAVAAERFRSAGASARRGGAHWMEAQAVIGLRLCDDPSWSRRWIKARSQFPNAPTAIESLIVGTPRVMWTLTI